MRRLNIGCLIVSFAFSIPPTAGAQPRPLVAGTPTRLPIIEGKDIRFTHLSTEQGLSQSRVDHMLQDRRGFIWIGTYNGLNRYDGYRFKTYKPDANNPNSLSGALVLPLFEDRSGILWIGVDAGLDRFDPTTERFTHFRIDPNNPDSPSGEVEHITQDRDGMLWLATRNGLDRLDPASGQFSHYRNDPNDPHSLASNDVRFLLEDRQGTFWVATATGLDTFDRRTGRVLGHYPSSQQVPFDRILEDRAGMFWLCATRGGGLASLDRETGRFTRYTFFDDRRDVPGMRGCSDILEDQHGMLWLATNPDGVVKFDRELGRLTRYRNDPANPTSLNNNEALSLLEDREGGIWVGTNGGGANRFPSTTPPFTVYRNEPGNPNSLDQSYALSVFEDSQGMLWIGTSQLNRLDRKTGRYTFYRPDPADPGSITSGKVYAIAEDPAGFMWFGTWGGGLNRFDRRTGRFKAYRHDPADATSLSHDFVMSLLIDRGGNLWVGGYDGLNRLDARTGRFTVFRPKSGSIEHTWYRVLAEDTDGSIWMGTYTQGLQRLDVRTGEIVRYQNDPKIRGSLSNNRVNALCLDHRGALWVGTQNGLNRFDRNTAEFRTFGERDGLPNNAIEGILEDSAGNLWLSTGNGLSRFDPRARTFTNYFSEDGLAGDEFTDFSVYYKSASGEMFFGGVNGVTAFYPEKVVDSPFVPPVVLTDFRLFNDPVPVGGSSPLEKSISYAGSLTLSHSQSIFSLEFSALSYARPTRTRYRYRLEDLETHWNEVAATYRVVTYTTLPAGMYHFRVQSEDNRGEWSEPGLTLAIRVLPAWWNTWQFRTVWISSLLLLTWFVYQFRVRQLQRESKRLREVIDTVPGYVWSALPDGSVDFINRRWLDFSGFSLEQGLGWGWVEAIHPEDRAHFVEAWREAFASGKPMETEARVHREDGQYRWLLIRNVPLHHGSGKIVKWYGTSTDIDDRKRAEETLRKQANLLDLTHDTIFVMDMEGLIKYWNRGAEEQYGWSAEQAVGTVVHDLLKTVFPVPLEQIKAELTRTGRWEGELVHTRKDKTEVLVESRWSLQCDEQGAPVAILETNSDITERKRAEEALRRSEAYLAEGQRLSHTGSWAWSPATGRSTYWSEEMFRIFDLNPEQGVPTAETFWQRIHPEDYDRTYELLQKARLGNMEYQHEHRIVLPNGTVKHIHAIGHPVLGENGQVAEYVGTAMDVTEQKRAKEALRRSEAYLTDAQRLSHTGSWAYDGTTRKMLYWSEETFRLWGFDPQQGLPTWEQILQRIQPEDRYELENLPTMLQTGDKEFEFRILLPDGTVKHVHSLVHPVLSPTGEVLEVVGTTVDITERKRAEEERERLRQLEADLAHINRVSIMGELGASIAHEVNQPLAGVVSNGSACLRWLAGEAPNLEEARESARRIVRDGKRTGEVIARIRALTRRAEMPREKLDLNDTMREVLALVGDEAKGKSVIIRTRFAADLSPVSGDRVQLQQVALNLVMNGIQAMSSVGERARELLVTTRNLDADQVQVTVEDSGIGIDPQTLDKIFDSFYTTKPSGMGMGLSISRSILQAHGGRLWATAKDGPGTMFHFTLPKYDNEGSNAGV